MKMTEVFTWRTDLTSAWALSGTTDEAHYADFWSYVSRDGMRTSKWKRFEKSCRYSIL